MKEGIARLRSSLPVAAAATRAFILFVTVLSIPLAAAETIQLSETELSSWILALYGLPGLLSLALIFIYRQPLLLTGNVFVIIFISRLGAQLTYPEMVGASMLTGVVVGGMGLLRFTDRLAKWIPGPIIFGLLAGAVLSFVVGIFNQVNDAPLLVGGTLLAFLLARRFLSHWMPAIFPALLVGLLIAVLRGSFGSLSTPLLLHAPVLIRPVLSVPAVLTGTIVFVVLITLQANLPSVSFLQSQAYHPPNRVLDAVSGVGTLLGSLLGPTGISLSLPITSLVAGPEAGVYTRRHWAAALGAISLALIGLLASVAANLAALIPLPLLLGLAGLALLNVLSQALREMASSPSRLGPLFNFVVAASDISLFGLGSFFWALALGVGVSLLLERETWGKRKNGVERM